MKDRLLKGSETMIIRKAEPKDFDGMNRLFKQVDGVHSKAHPNMFNEPIDNVRSNEYLKNILDDDTQNLIVCVDGDEVVGLAKAMIESAPEFPLFVQRRWMLISIIVVDEMHRGKGIGQLLLDDQYKWAKDNDINEVELTVFSFNETAMKFYSKNGFNEVKRKLYKKI